MPFRPQEPLLNVDLDKMATTIDTRSVEDIFGLWAVFSKTANALPEGKRLENMLWRVWNREAFCCCPNSTTSKRTSRSSDTSSIRRSSQDRKVPDLASSIDTVSSDEDEEEVVNIANQTAPPHVARPELRRMDSGESRSRGHEKHISPDNLKDMVASITSTEKKPIESLVLPTLSTSPPPPEVRKVRDPSPLPKVQLEGAAFRHEPQIQLHREEAPAATNMLDVSEASPNSSTSSKGSSAAMSTHNVVRGFDPRRGPSSYRSMTQLATPSAPISKHSARNMSSKKKPTMFTLGTSSGEEESSLESRIYKSSMSSISENMMRQKHSKQAALQQEDDLAAKSQDSPVFESDDEDDDDDIVSEGVIEDDEDSSDWEDELGDDDKSDTEETPVFQRVDSRPDLTSRRSLLTTLMNEPDRARALQSAASRSTPALRRTQTTPPESSSRAHSPSRERGGNDGPPQHTGTRAIAMAAQSAQPHLALSPRTTRRQMLSDELTESLRRNLLWERQYKSSQNLAALRRRHTSHDIKNLKQYPELPHMSATSNATQYNNDYFNAGLGAYHSKGW